MTTLASPAAETFAAVVEVRKLGVEDLREALRDGLNDFLALRGDLLCLGLIYPLVGLVSSAAILRQQLVPLAFPLAAGLSLLGPAVAAGFYELARRRQHGLDVDWRHFFDVYRKAAAGDLAILTLILAGLFLAWLGAAWAIYLATLGAAPMASAGDFLHRLFETPEGWALIVAGNLTGLLIAAIALGIGVVSFPMLVDRPVGARVAVETSLRAVARNPGVMALWGAIVAGLLFLGSIPLFAGLAVVLPVLGYASWRLYTRAVSP